MEVEWLMTAPHPWKRAHRSGYDDNRVGWRWHAVPPPFPLSTRAQSDRTQSLCGVRPRHGWSADLFADELCERCRLKALKLGIEIPTGLIRSVVAEYKQRKALEKRSEGQTTPSP